MANPEHVERIGEGAQQWNEWRGLAPGLLPDLEGANLSGRDMRRYDLSGANLSGAFLSRSDLREARLVGARLNRARLDGATLADADLAAASLLEASGLTRLRFSGARNIPFAEFSSDALSQLGFPKDHTARLARRDFRGYRLSELNLRGADFQSFDLSEAALQDCDLRHAKLNGKHTRLTKANLHLANMEGALCLEAAFGGASFLFANLRSADLGGADLAGADLRLAELAGCNLQSANLREVKYCWRAERPDLLAAHNFLFAFYSAELIAELGLPPNHNQLLEERDFTGYDLHAACLQRANLANAKLKDCNCAGANFTGANLTNADLTGAKLTDAALDHAVLRGASLTGARLGGAILEGASLQGADLGRAALQRIRGQAADFRGAKLQAANFAHAYLDGANLERAQFGETDLREASLRDAKLTGANLTKCTLAKADLDGANLAGGVLIEARLDGCSFTSSNLSNSDLTDASAAGAVLKGASLRGAILRNASLDGADLSNADLTDADLRRCDFRGAAVDGAVFVSANVQGAHFEGVPGLAAEQVSSAHNHKLAFYASNLLHDFALPPDHNVRLTNHALEGYDLRGADLRGLDMERGSLAGANLAGADLTGGTLRGTNLKNSTLENATIASALLENVDLSHAKVTGARLTGSRLVHVRLEGTILRDCELQDSDLTEVSGLLPHQLAGASCALAKLPAGVKEFDALGRVNEACKTANKWFYSLLGVCLYCWAIALATRDSQLLNYSVTPIPGWQVPAGVFFVTAGIGLLILFLVSQFILQHLWEELSQLPAIFPDGGTLFRKVFPSLLNVFVCAHFPVLRRERRVFSYLQTGLGVLTTWWLVPITVVLLWGRYLRRHEAGGTIALSVASIAAILVAASFQRLASATLDGSLAVGGGLGRVFDRRHVRLTACLAALLTVGYAAVVRSVFRQSPYRERSLARHHETASRDPDCIAVESAFRPIPIVLDALRFKQVAWLEGQEISVRRVPFSNSPDLEPGQVLPAQLSGRNLRYAWARRAFFGGADLSSADLTGAYLRYADLRRADLMGANLRCAVLGKAVLRGATLTYASVEGADFSEADLTNSDLAGVDFRKTLGLSLEQIRTAKRWESNLMPEYIRKLHPGVQADSSGTTPPGP